MITDPDPLPLTADLAIESNDLVRLSALESSRAWVRPIIAIMVAPFLYAYVAPTAAWAWLGLVLALEGVSFLLRGRMAAGDLRFDWAIQANTVAISLAWVVHAVLLWQVDGVIPAVAAVMDLFTIALYAAIGSYHSVRLFLCLVLPQLAALAFLLISYLLHHAPPLIAGTASLATIGACATILMNGVAMNAADAKLRRTNQQLRRMAKAAEAASQAKSDFLSTMSHEIRTPLNGVLGMVQAMAHDDLPPLQRERLEMIGESGEALLTILNDILDLSKIEAGRMELEAADFDLARLAMGAQRTFAQIADDKGVAFSLEIEDAARGVYRGDATRVRQVLYNLISNAVKFTAVGAVDVRIARSDQGVRFSVTDTGIGMTAEQAERLFDKFVQGDSSTTRKFGGTGLGLSICRELCHAMGGEIAATSRLGQGSCFTVHLPLTRMGEARPDRAPDTAKAPLAFDAAALRVLAAEDNRMNQLVLETLLAQAGIKVTLVDNGLDAVKAWEAGAWDVILMDVQMPVMDGPTAAQRIRDRETETGRAATPIIALTANAMDHQVSAYKAAGMTDFVAKPIQVRALFDALSQAAGVGG